MLKKPTFRALALRQSISMIIFSPLFLSSSTFIITFVFSNAQMLNGKEETVNKSQKPVNMDDPKPLTCNTDEHEPDAKKMRLGTDALEKNPLDKTLNLPVTETEGLSF